MSGPGKRTGLARDPVGGPARPQPAAPRGLGPAKLNLARRGLALSAGGGLPGRGALSSPAGAAAEARGGTGVRGAQGGGRRSGLALQ